MNTTSISDSLEFKQDKPSISVLLETPFTKEIRIAMRAGQIMKEHQTAYPIVVHIIDGVIDFGVEKTVVTLKKGNLIALDEGVPHDLKAKEDTVIRLTLSKSDQVDRVKNIDTN